MKRLKNLKKKLIIIATVMLLVLFSALPIFADQAEEIWYYPNKSIELISGGTPYYSTYYFDFQLEINGEIISFSTGTDHGLSNLHADIDGNILFGDIEYTDFILTYNTTTDNWIYQTATIEPVVVPYTDIKVRLVILENSVGYMSNLISWFDTNFTEIAPLTNADISVSFIEILTSGISNLASGIGSGVNSFVGDLFLNASGNGLSTFGFVVAIFGGLALACGLTKLIFEWIRSIGN